MRVICTTVIRNTAQGEPHGYIYEIDWDEGRVVRRLDVPPSFTDGLALRLGPRGGIRGGRGVRVAPDGVYVASHNTILKYDRDWRQIGEITHPLLNGVHEIDLDGDGLWVSSTGLDLAIKLDWSGRLLKTWSPRTSESLKGILGVSDVYDHHWPPRLVNWRYPNRYDILRYLVKRIGDRIEPAKDSRHRSNLAWHALRVEPETRGERFVWGMYRRFPALMPNGFHLNCVFRYGQEIHITIANWPWRSRACVVQIEPEEEVELGREGVGKVHNGQILDDEHLIINDTDGEALKVFERGTGRLVKSILCWEMGIEGAAWLRGMRQLDNGRVLVGVGSSTEFREGQRVIGAATQIVELDLEEGRVIKRVVLSDDRDTSVHGLDVVV